MSQVLIKDLQDQFKRSISMVRTTINRFNAQQWQSGIPRFRLPSTLSYHIVECLDYYFRDPSQEFGWGSRLPPQPSQQAVLGYLDEIEARIAQHFAALDDADLVTPYDEQREHAQTRLGHYVYALRHTMHHHGSLTLLSIHHGNAGGSWE
jgi:DinB superfamily